MTSHRILIVGSTGFVGSRVAPLLAAPRPGADGAELRLLVHQRDVSPTLASRPSVETAYGDLTNPSSLHGICDGIDTVLHLGSCIGGSATECQAVNDAGSAALVDEATRAGVSRIVRLGTTAVYLDGAHRCAAEGELALAPNSITSATRLAGEQRVLAAGGVVVRPHLVFGEGDRWVVPTMAKLITAVPHWVEGARALLSMIHVDDLARCLAALALHPELPRGGVLHAAHPVPVPSRMLLSAVADALELPQPYGEITLDEAVRMLTNGRGGEEARRRLAGLSTDRWYDSSRLWQLLDLNPGPGFAERFQDCVPWYQGHLALVA